MKVLSLLDRAAERYSILIPLEAGDRVGIEEIAGV